MYTLFNQDSKSEFSDVFLIPQGYAGYFMTTSLDGMDHCIAIDTVTPPQDIAQEGGLGCDGVVIPGFIEGSGGSVDQLYINCEQATLSTLRTKALLSLPGYYRLRLVNVEESLGVVVVVMSLIPADRILPALVAHEIMGDSCVCEESPLPEPCPSYPILDGFMFGPGDVIDPEATVEITFCGYDGSYWIYPSADSSGKIPHTYPIGTCESEGAIGYAANISKCAPTSLCPTCC